MKKLFLTIIMTFILMVMVTPVTATYIDGKYDPSEGYTNGHSVTFEVKGKWKWKDKGTIPAPSEGEIWYRKDLDNNDLYVAFIQPTDLVDNSYGNTSIGWGKNVAPSGKNHNFNDLLESDKAQFQFTNDEDEIILDFTLDYLYELKEEGYGSGFGGGKDSEVKVGSESDIPEVASSLQYNWDTYGSANPGYFGKDAASLDASYEEPGDWLYNVIYEFKVDGKLYGDEANGIDFSNFNISKLNIALVHDSPNKIGRNKVYPNINGSIQPVPEPGTMILLVTGLIGLAGLGRKRFRKGINT